jgi:hypothetical protein
MMQAIAKNRTKADRFISWLKKAPGCAPEAFG